jgi:hypothetical protein
MGDNRAMLAFAKRTAPYTPTKDAIYKRAVRMNWPEPITSSALALSEAKLRADAILHYHKHRRDCDTPSNTCPKCVLIRNLLVDIKLTAQAQEERNLANAGFLHG